MFLLKIDRSPTMSQTYTNPTEEKPRPTLRDLPLAARVALTAFLASVAIGYLAALVQLKVQHAEAGEMMPTPEKVVKIYHGGDKSQIERLVEETNMGLPFNGTGQMRAAFFLESTDYDQAILDKADFEEGNKEKMAKAKVEVDLEREGEAEALLAWIGRPRLEHGRNTEEVLQTIKDAYDKDRFVLPDDLQSKPITADYIIEEDGQKICKIKTLFTQRCVRCHKPTARSEAKEYPLDTFTNLTKYVLPSKGLSLNKLAQTTHVHLLGFSMLYGITGIIFAFSSFPGVIRLFLAPAALVAQVVDISFWWLARMEPPHGPMFAKGIVFTGGIVASALALQILLSMFDMFGKVGRAVIILTLVAILTAGALFVKPQLDSYLQQEKSATTAVSE
jgi:hypothetical protein